ncbi:MAG: hypothetical protein ACREIU_12065 [Planctomycetota bacterium]
MNAPRLGLSFLLISLPLGQGPSPPPPVRSGSVTGEVVDFACRLFPRRGDHACSSECLKGGVLPGVFDEGTGKAFLAFAQDRTPAGAALAPLAGKRAHPTGKIHEGKGIRAIVCDGVGKADGERPASAPAPPSLDPPREITLLASVVNVLDQVEASAKGTKHACTARCLEGGGLYGLLDLETGRLYGALAPERKSARSLLEPFAGLKARVSGRVVLNVVEVLRVVKA